jgi:putative hydroxymethylpyrimidine transport system substrate-binding protein
LRAPHAVRRPVVNLAARCLAVHPAVRRPVVNLAIRRLAFHPAVRRPVVHLATRRLAFSALLACACAAALAACGSKQDTLSAPAVKPFTVMLDFFPNADHAALYSAIANGDFRAVGLDVRPETPSDPSTPLKLLAAGRVDMAISYEPELLLARDQGLKVVSIGALVQRPLTSIIALPGAHVRTVADLAGKRVGTAGIGYQAAELRTALQAAGVSPSSVREANVGFDLVPAMLSGKVAATLGGFWNYEALQLRQMHRKPVVIPVDRAGVPTYDELVLVVREDEAGRRGQDLRAFLQALTRGARQARANPAAAAALISKANPSAEEKLQLASLRATLPATLPADRSKPYGWQDPSAWASFGSWMKLHGLIHTDPNREALPPFTNEFLPGQGI